MSLSAWSTMEVDANTNKGLCLSLSLGGHYAYVPKNQVVGLDLSFTLRPKDEPVTTITTVHDGSRSTGDGEAEVTTVSNGSDNNHLRKKLRLTKDQSSLLEDSFKLHTTLNPAQKQGLARQLNLKPRQVEVWFQNRRARTKLKQTEIDCEVLKRCCERLSEENKRLKTELHELRSLKFPTSSSSPPLCIGPPKLTMCPSCENVAGDVTGYGGSD